MARLLVRKSDLYGLMEFKRATGAEGGIVVTKDELGVKCGIALIPASIFLFLV